jgi:hypothetical protein
MIPAYQRSELEYDNRIKRRLIKGLEKKYTNQQLIKFQGQDSRADDLFLSLEKMLYLIYALLQESHTYLFAIGTQSEEANRRERHPVVPTPERPRPGRQRLFPTKSDNTFNMRWNRINEPLLEPLPVLGLLEVKWDNFSNSVIH